MNLIFLNLIWANESLTGVCVLGRILFGKRQKVANVTMPLFKMHYVSNMPICSLLKAQISQISQVCFTTILVPCSQPIPVTLRVSLTGSEWLIQIHQKNCKMIVQLDKMKKKFLKTVPQMNKGMMIDQS